MLFVHKGKRLLEGVNVNDEGVCQRSFLRSENGLAGLSVEGVGPQAVDGLGWEGHQLSFSEEFGGLLQGFLRKGFNHCFAGNGLHGSVFIK